MIYIASPYTHKNKKVMQNRYEAVCAFCAQATLTENFVYSPIAHWHPIAIKHLLPRNAEWWKEYNEHFLALASELWVLKLGGWMESEGILREVKFAKARGIKISKFKGGSY